MSDNTLLYLSVTVVITLVIGILTFIKSFNRPENEGLSNESQGAIPRTGARTARARMRAAAEAEQFQYSESEEEPVNEGLPDATGKGNLSKKKLMRMQAKAQRDAEKEEEEQRNEEKKRVEEEDKLKQAEKKAEEKKIARARRAEKVRQKKEEKRKEQEEYEQLRAAFEVEESGFEAKEDDKEEKVVQYFVQHIKTQKIVVLEDLASRFFLKTTDVIKRIEEMQENGTLTGVMDDRGKFIYITDEELESVARFMKQRGRVSLAEMADKSNELIRLEPSQIIIETQEEGLETRPETQETEIETIFETTSGIAIVEQVAA